MKDYFVAVLFLLIYLNGTNLSAQVDSTWKTEPHLEVMGFADIFYVYDFNKPQGTNRQDFLFNHNRHNEFNVNLGLVKFSLTHPKYRGHFGLQTGTYANDNYVAEPGLLKNIFEANIGISLNKKNTFWLDAGVLPSHIGIESAISTDNLTLTRSLSAESSPFFITGLKLTLQPNDKWEVAALVVNGWQRIQRLEGNSRLSFGTQVLYKSSDKITLNWSTFIGTDDPDPTRRMRYFNNFYGHFQITDQFDLVAGFDFGRQQTSNGSSDYDTWFGPVLISRLTINDFWKVVFRAEYFQDKSGVVIPTNAANGFQTTGLSINFDYSPAKHIICRFEGRWLNSKDEIFEKSSNLTSNNFILGTSVAIKFSESIL